MTLYMRLTHVLFCIIYVVSGFERTNSLLENQTVCLNLCVSISPVIIKSQSNMEIFLLTLNTEMVKLKTTGEQTTKGLKPLRQATHKQCLILNSITR